MCRLMGYVAPKNLTITEIAGPEFAEFTALSAKHGDGWGYATLDGDKKSLTLDTARAKESSKYSETTSQVESSGALLHLRWATLNLDISEGNTHPFTFEDFVFIHNGSINPPKSLDPFNDKDLFDQFRGDTDSERYFYVVISFIRKFGLHEGVRQAVHTIREHCSYSSINAMLMTPDLYLTISEHNNDRIPEGEGPGYYDLFYRKNEDGILVASSGWSQEGWKQIPNHHVFEVNRRTFEGSLTKI